MKMHFLAVLPNLGLSLGQILPRVLLDLSHVYTHQHLYLFFSIKKCSVMP